MKPSTHVPRPERATTPAGPPARVARMAAELVGSEILQIAAEIRARKSAGAKICNLTVGDFAPSEFPIPELLSKELQAAVAKGETNYPPSTGIPALRKSIVDFCAKRLGMKLDNEQVLIACGARPIIYGAYRVLVDPGDKVVFPVPSWNNSHYCQMSGAIAVRSSNQRSARRRAS